MGWLDWLNDMFGPGSSEPDYWDKKFRERMAKEQKEKDEIFDMSKNVDQINERRQKDIISYRRSQLKEHKEQIMEERRKEDKAIDDLKIVIDTAKLQCDRCTNPVGDLKVNYNTPTIQGKRTATVKEKDQTSLIFKGNCKQSPNSSSPCASVMKLGKWKDIGNVKFQEEYVLLQKSTIKCNYGGTDIKITDCAQRNEPTNIGAVGAPVPTIKPFDFDLKFELDTNHKTIVPFGIVDFQNNLENQFFRFKYTLEKSDIDEFYFEIITENGEQLYESNCLKPAIIDNEYKDPFFKTEKASQIPMNSALIPEGSPDFEPKDYTAMGSYTLSWDGFDKDGIYDSTRFNNKDLKARITAIKNGRRKSIVVDFSTKYDQVEWTDVKIDKNTKRIDVTLRVNLTDGGENGLTCQAINASDIYGMPARTVCDWDKIPANKINNNQPIIKSRTRSFLDLEKLAIEGLNYHWGRNKKHAVSKKININGDNFEVYTNATNTTENAMDDVSLIYNTNNSWLRSGNPGTVQDPMSAVGNVISRESICYNIGYIEYFDGWAFSYDTNEDLKFKFTTAHEIGHTILKAYGGTIYSYGHKKTVNAYTQKENTNATKYPLNGEIDIMPYHINTVPISDYNRYIAAIEDILSLLWLTKISVK